jgi:flagellar protein FlaG
MTNDVGMIKAVQPSVAQTHPTAPIGRAPKDVQAAQDADPAGRAAEAAKEQEPLDDVVSNLNNLVRDLQRELQFSVDEDSGSTIIKVVDRETDEVVRQIPSEDLVNLRKRLEEAAGVFFEDSA